MGVRIKFCGITRLADAERGIEAGADALGFVFHAASPRYVEPARAAAIVRDLPPFVCRVGLFVNVPRDEIAQIVDAVGIDVVQYHGDEPPDECAGAPRPWIKAIRMHEGVDVASEAQRYVAANALLLDTYDAAVYGGSGRAFDWRLVPRALARPVILAGGLSPANVGAAITAARPYAVDVSGGIESAPGIKDPAKMTSFVAEVRRIERDS